MVAMTLRSPCSATAGLCCDPASCRGNSSSQEVVGAWQQLARGLLRTWEPGLRTGVAGCISHGVGNCSKLP